MNFFCLQTQGLYPEVCIDMEVSSDEDDVLKPDASVGKQKKSAGDDAKDEVVSSAEPIAPNLISSGAPGQSNPSAAGRVAASIFPIGKHGCKRPPPSPRHNRPLDQVMTQIEIPPYRDPYSPWI
jgi:hypothetical protein